MGVDVHGNPTPDPSANVRDLNEAANQRQDDLREAERRYNDLRAEHQKETSTLRAEHAKDLSAKESNRLDSIRQVDREEVAKTAAQANQAIGLLAKQTTELATTLQNTVANTAAAAETRRTADMAEVNKRVSALELAGSASAGKQQIADPQMEKLLKTVETLLAAQATGSGKNAGINAVWVFVLGAFGLVATALGIYAALKP